MSRISGYVPLTGARTVLSPCVDAPTLQDVADGHGRIGCDLCTCSLLSALAELTVWLYNF